VEWLDRVDANKRVTQFEAWVGNGPLFGRQPELGADALLM